ncbi:MAG TPA: DUF1801 domain-containing protein [Candidatus Limnocylindrales bacterium]|nr:DUF1801 domain-containing protein [Candidatus Limnocylindrales bacterium]
MEAIPPEALLETCPPSMRTLAECLRRVVRATLPDATERVRPGWRLIGYDVPIGPRRTRYVCFVLPELEHVHLGFEHGVLMRDPDRQLQGAGITKQVRWVTFRPGDEIDPRPLATLLAEAARVAGLTAAERRAIADERSARLDG